MTDRSDSVDRCVIGAWYWLSSVPFAVQYMGRSREHLNDYRGLAADKAGPKWCFYIFKAADGTEFLLHPTEHARADR